MKIIERYVLQSFLTAFFLAWLVLSFVMTIGLLVKITQLLISGLPMRAVGLFMLVGFPETLQLTVPLGLLVSSLLVFSRLSADSEIAAMRACGVNLLMIMKWPLIVAVICTVLGFYVNNEIVPRGHDVRRNLRSLISVDVGVDLLEPGRFITDFPNLTLWFAKKEGNWISDLLVFDHSQKGMTREIRAEKALVSTNGLDIVLEMYKVRVDPIEFGHPGVASADRFKHVIPNALKRRGSLRNEKDMRFNEIMQEIHDLKGNVESLPPDLRDKRLSVFRTKFQTRFVYASAAIFFVLIGVPLGIRTHRKESTIGMALSIAVALTFYLGVIVANSLEDMPMFLPHVLVWLPVAICAAIAMVLIPKNL
jgi:lipopolysaccharide export system permease protein